MVQGMVSLTVVLAVVTFVLSTGLTRVVLGHAKRRWLDRPGARSSHRVPTPTGGGLGALAAYSVVIVLGLALDLVPHSRIALLSIVACVAPLAIVGLLDDVHDLPRSLRYCAHVAVGTMVIIACGPAKVAFLHHIPELAWCVFTVIAFTYVLNAYNFMDGLDGLVGATGVAQLVFFAGWTHDGIAALLAGAYAGFLVWNWPPARIFMGDVGSTNLGALIATLFIFHSPQLEYWHTLVLLPLLGDSAYTIVRRLIRGENILRAHHSHIYQRLLRAGHAHKQITTAYVVLTILLGVIGTIGGLPASVLGLGLMCGCTIAAEVYLRYRQVPFTRPQPESAPTRELSAATRVADDQHD